MKKILVSLLVLCLAFSFTACGSSNTTDEGNTDAVVDTVETEAPVVDETEAVEPETEPVVEEPETEAAVAYTYTELSQTMYAKRDVNVRDLPSVDGNKVDGLSFAEEVTVTGKCNETGWYRINYGGQTAYVSNNYLVSEKPAPQEPVAQAPAETAPTETAPAEEALVRSPWVLYDAPYYDANTGSVFYFYLENEYPQNYDEINLKQYGIACDYYTSVTGKTGDFVFISHPMGRFLEGKVAMMQLYIE